MLCDMSPTRTKIGRKRSEMENLSKRPFCYNKGWKDCFVLRDDSHD